MRALLILIFFSFYMNANTPPSVKHVDPKFFSGLWYEIARTYNSFEKDCVAATVEYKLDEDNNYDVFNRCFDTTIGGKLIEYKGLAKPLEDNSMAKLKMTYYWIFSNNYRVIYLNNYKSTVVTSDDLEYVWIMNRKPFMKEDELNNILSFLGDYIDLSELIYTPQDEKGRYR